MTIWSLNKGGDDKPPPPPYLRVTCHAYPLLARFAKKVDNTFWELTNFFHHFLQYTYTFCPRFAYLSWNRLLIMLVLVEKKLGFFTQTLQVQMTNSHWSPRPRLIPNHCHLSDPPHFLFLSTFNDCDAGNPVLLPLEGMGLWNLNFFGPKCNSLFLLPFQCPKKSRFQDPPLSMALVKGECQNIKIIMSLAI